MTQKTEDLHEVEDPKVKYYEPKPEGEKRFWKDHMVKKHADRNGNGDDVFSGTINTVPHTHKGNLPKGAENVFKDTTVIQSAGVKARRNAVAEAARRALAKADLSEAENPSMGAGATSDSPGVGQSSMGGKIDDSGANQQSPAGTKVSGGAADTLEKIAMQAADLHDKVSNEDKEVNDWAQQKLAEVKDALDEVYEYMANGTGGGDTDNAATDTAKVNPNVKEDIATPANKFAKTIPVKKQAKPSFYTKMKESRDLTEKLAADATAADYIDDFVHSTDPKFDGKSKEKRKEMALAAFYAAQQNEEAKMVHSVHVRDYGDDDHTAASQFQHPDFDKTVKAHGGDFHYHSDKGVAFKFAQPHNARAFAGEVNRKFKSLDADTPEHVHEEAKLNEGAMMDHMFKIKHKHLETGETKEAHIRARDAAEARNAIEGHYGHSKQDWKYLGTKQVAEEAKLNEGDPIVRTKSFPGEPPVGTYAYMRRQGTLPKPVQAKSTKEEVEISEKVEVTIKKQTSDEPNVSKRHVTYDVYHDGKYHKTFKDINDAMDHKEKMQEATDPAAPKRGRGRPAKPDDAEEASDTHIIMQLRKASSIGKPVTFKNGETHPVSKTDARKALAMHDAHPTTIKKDEFANRLHQSHGSFKSAVAGQAEAPPLDLMQKILAARAARKAGQ